MDWTYELDGVQVNLIRSDGAEILCHVERNGHTGLVDPAGTTPEEQAACAKAIQGLLQTVIANLEPYTRPEPWAGILPQDAPVADSSSA